MTSRARRPVTPREGVALHPEPLRGDPALVAEVDALVRDATRHVDCAARIAALEHALREVLATAAAACDELGMRRTARGETMVAPVSALRRAAQRAGVPWPDRKSTRLNSSH